MVKVTVLGGGSYGTAMAVLAARNGHSVTMVLRDERQVNSINEHHTNNKRFSDVKLSDQICASLDVKTSIRDANLIIYAIPVQSTRDFLLTHKDSFRPTVPVVFTSKGICCESRMFLSEITEKIFKQKAVPLVFLSGPSFAKDIVDNSPIGLVLASKHIEDARMVAFLLSGEYCKMFLTTDVMGVEIGGALKNPLAIVCGMVNKLGYGSSTAAMIVTMGCREMRLIARRMGGNPETLAGLSGIGDLMLTCFSSLSRNYRFGQNVASGMCVGDALTAVGETVEGYKSALVLPHIIQACNLLPRQVPLFHLTSKILSGELKIEEAMKRLRKFKWAVESFA